MKKILTIIVIFLCLFLIFDKVFADTTSDYSNNYSQKTDELYKINISNEDMTCKQVLGTIITKILKSGITIIQIICAIIAIVKGMLTIVPAVIAKDADELKKGSKTLTSMGIILLIALLFRPVVTLIGKVLDFDISCIM